MKMGTGISPLAEPKIRGDLQRAELGCKSKAQNVTTGKLDHQIYFSIMSIPLSMVKFNKTVMRFRCKQAIYR